MGVYCTCYIGYGYKLPFSAYRRLEDKMGQDDFEAMIEPYYMSSSDYKIAEVNGLSMIVDGMGGDWVFFGKIYHKFVENEHDSVEIPFRSSVAADYFIAEEIARIFGKSCLEGVSPNMHYIAHYT